LKRVVQDWIVDVLRQLKAGQSVRNAAKITGRGVSTVQRVKLALAA
jgi:transposase